MKINLHNKKPAKTWNEKIKDAIEISSMIWNCKKVNKNESDNSRK